MHAYLVGTKYTLYNTLLYLWEGKESPPIRYSRTGDFPSGIYHPMTTTMVAGPAAVHAGTPAGRHHTCHGMTQGFVPPRGASTKGARLLYLLTWHASLDLISLVGHGGSAGGRIRGRAPLAA